MPEPVATKLRHFLPLSAEDVGLLHAGLRRLESYAAHTDVIQEGSEPRYLNVVLQGWICRYKQLEDGRRQIIAFFVPGDMCDPCVFLLDNMSHALATLTPATIARVSEPEILKLMQTSPGLTKAFWLEMLVSADIQREWTVSLGRRTAIERLAHLLCELLVRLRAVGLNEGPECELPLTQTDLGDALGLSSVHVNRTLQELRGMRLIELKGRRLVVRNETALQALALFNPDYLHFQRSVL